MIEPRYGVLQSLFVDRVFRIPSYQRFYSWQPRQRDDLFADLRKLATRDTDQHHFMATIVCHRTAETRSFGASQYRIYDIVDGQQRMTTLILLLKCIELAMPADSEDRADLAKILVKRDQHLILLQTNNANEFIFNRFIRDGIHPQDGDIETHSDENLARGIRDCTAFVKEWEGAHGLGSLVTLLLHRLGFVVYDTEDSRVVYGVFEVLNSRGLAVDWLDKTKSVLMGRASELSASTASAEAEIQGLQGIWSLIYREIAKESIPGEEILRVTATLYYGPGQGKPRSADESLELLRMECDAFQKPRQISERLLDVARKLVEIHGNASLGPATQILHARVLAVAIMSAKGVDKHERGKLLEQWERVTFRIFGLYGKDSRTKVGDYVRVAAKIVTEDLEMRTYNQIMNALRALGRDHPIDGAVMDGLVGTDCYERSPDMCRYILWLYEEGLAAAFGSGATTDEHERTAVWKRRAIDSVEHIFPQHSGAESGWKEKMRRSGKPPEAIEANVGRIGNLLLLPILLNQQAKASSFATKKAIYAKHSLRMIQQVCECDDWNLDEIEMREEKIVEWAKSRWCDV